MPRTGLPKTTATRQAEYQARLRVMTPVERAIFKAGYRHGRRVPDPYTPEERAAVLKIQSLLAEAATLAGALNRQVKARLEADPSQPYHAPALEELEGRVIRYTMPTY
jgi:hypothetical protein